MLHTGATARCGDPQAAEKHDLLRRILQARGGQDGSALFLERLFSDTSRAITRTHCRERRYREDERSCGGGERRYRRPADGGDKHLVTLVFGSALYCSQPRTLSASACKGTRSTAPSYIPRRARACRPFCFQSADCSGNKKRRQREESESTDDAACERTSDSEGRRRRRVVEARDRNTGCHRSQFCCLRGGSKRVTGPDRNGQGCTASLRDRVSSCLAPRRQATAP